MYRCPMSANDESWPSRRYRCALLLITGLLAFGGCKPVPRAPVPPPPLQLEVLQPELARRTRRIAVVGFENSTHCRHAAYEVQSALAAAMRMKGCCEMVDMSHYWYDLCRMDAVLRAEYPIEVLARAWREFHCDAVMFARVNDFNPYPPLSLSVTIRIVDAADAVLVGALDQHWSLADPQVLAAYQQWLEHRFPNCRQPEIYLASPLVFRQFAMEQVATHWCRVRAATMPRR
ncbi:MAG: hypothetical protein ACR2NP_22620 [Pirellulaceae bacterium]